MSKPVEFKAIDAFCEPFLDNRMTGVEVSSAHAKPHLFDVAQLADLAAQIRGYPLRTRMLLRISALMHDVQRLPTEDPQVQDEHLSAQQAITLMEVADEDEVFPSTFSERQAVAFAIANHGKYPERFKDVKKRETTPETLEEQLRESLFIGDKMSQNGIWVIARRSAFVGGDRLQEGGDLQNFGFKPSSQNYIGQEVLVVAYESAIRLTFVNPQTIYPKIFRPLVDPLYQTQREFVVGLCKASGMDHLTLAEGLLETKRADGKNMLEARGINFEGDAQALSALISSRGGISRRALFKTSDNIAFSAVEAVKYFSSRYKDDLVQVAYDWQPERKQAKRWQQQMVEYLDGTWYRQMEANINA